MTWELKAKAEGNSEGTETKELIEALPSTNRITNHFQYRVTLQGRDALRYVLFGRVYRSIFGGLTEEILIGVFG